MGAKKFVRTKGDLRFEPDKIINAIKGSGGIITTIAKKLGVSWNTAKSYIEEHESTLQAYNDEEEKILDIADEQLYKAIKKGDLSAVKWLQATKGKKRGYVEKQIQEIQTTNESKYSDEEVDAIVRAFTEEPMKKKKKATKKKGAKK